MTRSLRLRRRAALAFLLVALGAGCSVDASSARPSAATATTTRSASPSPSPSTTAERQRAVTTMTAVAASAPLPAGDDTTVASVTDGDTIRVAGGTRVRLIGIDTPETVAPGTPVECFGPEASAHMKQLLSPGTAIRLAYDVDRFDRYGRTLAYVYRSADGAFVNAAMVRDGYASAYTVPPDVAHADDFVRLQREARDANRGLWSACPVTATPAVAPLVSGGAGASGSGSSCDPSYPDVCIPPAPPDLDCGDVTYRRFRVVAPDPHRFDANHDGVGCESG